MEQGKVQRHAGRFEEVRGEWRAITQSPLPSPARFEEVKREADRLIDAGLWTSGPADVLSVLGRQRDELAHSRLIGWLLVPTGRHGLGRAFVTELVDTLWPGEELMRSGAVVVDTEVSATGLDHEGRLREARADIVMRCEGLTVLMENKLDAGEQPDQCERLYWAWAADPGDTRWVFLTPTGRPPVTASSEAARAAWRTLSYAQLRKAVEVALDKSASSSAKGRPTAVQYLTTLANAVGASA